jgi:hypothetical protein
MFPFEILNYVSVSSIYNKAQDVSINAFQIPFPISWNKQCSQWNGPAAGWTSEEAFHYSFVSRRSVLRKCSDTIRVQQISCLVGNQQRHFDMDMSYTRVLHIKVAYRVPHKWRHNFYLTRPLICARITCYVTVIM